MNEQCPTCGQPVQVVGGVTMHYAPVASERERELVEALRAAMDYIDKSPCDPDIYDDQYAAYKKLEELSPQDILAAYDKQEQPMANEETYTVLLLRPDYQRDGETPWWDTYLWSGRANGADVAVSKAQADAGGSSGAEDPNDFAPLFVCFGEPEDITPAQFQ